MTNREYFAQISPEVLKARAEQGDADAQNDLGVMYMDGHGVEPDYDEALKWWRKAAEQGHAGSQHSLGTRKSTFMDDSYFRLFH